MRTVKVLHIFGRMNRGGAEMRTLELMEALSQDPAQRIQFDYCVLSGKPGELDGKIRALGGKVHYLPLRPGFGKKFRNMLREGSYASVHSHVHLFSGYMLRLAFQVNVPSRICHLHTTGDGNPANLRRSLQNRLMRQWLFRYATSVVGVSEGALEAFFREAPAFRKDPRSTLIYDAINPERFASEIDRNAVRASIGVPIDGIEVIHIGRIEPVKNHSRLVQLFASFLKTHPSAWLVLVGNADANAKADLEGKIEALGITRRVHFLGSRDDVPALLASADIMIFPSLWEGLPGVVLEASAARLPVLSNDLPGSRELAAFFPSVRCIALSESNETWAAAASALLETSRHSAASNSRLFDTPFTVAHCLEKLLPLWRGVSVKPAPPIHF
ncbi:MAG: glycosyltransferase [Cryobacterium sp.]|nr:glycosyltransferase [Oligoflexia bacterium]